MKYTLLSAFLLSAAILAAPVLGDPSKHQLPTQYVVDSVKGKVLILTAGSKTAEPADEEQTVQAGDEVITQDNSEASLTLNENTMFHLSANSRVKVSRLSGTAKKSFLSRLKLVAGNILAQVQKLNQSHSTFEVESGGVVCGVRGTAFEVQKEGNQVQTNTFEGVVEMSKDQASQRVSADHHGAFAADKGTFLVQRTISEREKARYENWRHVRELLVRRQAEREQALKVFDTLPQSQQEKMWQIMEQTKSKDRLKELRHMLRQKNLQQYLDMKTASVGEKSNAVQSRQKLEREAQEARELRLKNKQK